MAGWHHWLNGRESEWTPGVDDGQGGLACCDSWGCKESVRHDWATELNWTELNWWATVYGVTQSRTWRDWLSSSSLLPNRVYRFIVIPVILPVSFFHRTGTKISQFIWKHERPWIAKAVLRKKNGAVGIDLHDFRLYYKTIVIKTVW